MVLYSVAHDAGAVNVVVAGPTFTNANPESDVAVGILRDMIRLVVERSYVKQFCEVLESISKT